jgi:hypothetical protein
VELPHRWIADLAAALAPCRSGLEPTDLMSEHAAGHVHLSSRPLAVSDGTNHYHHDGNGNLHRPRRQQYAGGGLRAARARRAPA